MKKLMFLIFLVACLGSCKHQYDTISDFVTEEIIYPGRFDTIIARVGLERVELELLKAGRLPSSEIRLGKAKNTVVEYDNVKLEFDSVCSWVNIKGLTQPKMYRFTVYTTDEYGNKSVPQEIAAKPYSSADFDYLLMAAPRISASPWALELKWPFPSSVLLEYIDLTYEYTDKNNNEINDECGKGEIPVIQMLNLEPENEYSIDVRFRVVPKADNEVILDTIILKYTYQLNTPDPDDYRKNLIIREIRSNSYSWVNGALTITWNAVNEDYMQYTIVKYLDNGVEKMVTVPNEENSTVLSGFTMGSTLQIKSNYEVVGVPDTYIDSFDKEFDPLIDLDRRNWNIIYTSVRPAEDAGCFPSGTDASVGYRHAHIDGDERTMMSLAKPGGTAQGSINNGAFRMPPIFILDMQESRRFNYVRIWHRTTDTNDQLRAWAIQVFGSNDYQGPVNKFENPDESSATEDPTAWVSVGAIVRFPSPRTVLSPNMTLPIGDYRYVKIEYKEYYLTVSPNTVQIAEFYLGINSSMYHAD